VVSPLTSRTLGFLGPRGLAPASHALLLGSLLASLLVGSGACAEGADSDVYGLPPRDEAGGGGDDDDGSVIPPRDSGRVDTGPGTETDAGADSGPGADACSTALAAITFDFEAGASGWTHGISDGLTIPPAPSWPYDEWAHGTPTTLPCKAGKCFAISPTQNYAQCTRGYLVSPPVDLTACAGKNVALVFQHAYSFWTAVVSGTTYFDGGVVEASGNGTSWQVAQGTYPGTVKILPSQGSGTCTTTGGAVFGVNNKSGFVGVQTTTTKVELTLPAATITNTTRVRFSFGAGVSTGSATEGRGATAPGWRIDDVGFVQK